MPCLQSTLGHRVCWNFTGQVLTPFIVTREGDERTWSGFISRADLSAFCSRSVFSGTVASFLNEARRRVDGTLLSLAESRADQASVRVALADMCATTAGQMTAGGQTFDGPGGFPIVPDIVPLAPPRLMPTTGIVGGSGAPVEGGFSAPGVSRSAVATAAPLALVDSPMEATNNRIAIGLLIAFGVLVAVQR